MWDQTSRVLALCLALTLISGCKENLYSNLTEAEANEIVSVLYRAGTDASRTVAKDGTVTVMVDEADFAEAVETLKAQGYPKREYLTLGDVFQGDGFIVSQMEERARFIFAMTEELSRTIADIDGVLSARVHVVLPTADPMSRSRAPSSASVAIRHLASSPTEDLLPQIKMLVANSIEGLSYDKVSVVFIPAVEPAIVAPQPIPEAKPANSGWAAAAILSAGPMLDPVAVWLGIPSEVLTGAFGGAATICLLLAFFRILRPRKVAAPPKVRVTSAE